MALTDLQSRLQQQLQSGTLTLSSEVDGIVQGTLLVGGVALPLQGSGTADGPWTFGLAASSPTVALANLVAVVGGDGVAALLPSAANALFDAVTPESVQLSLGAGATLAFTAGAAGTWDVVPGVLELGSVKTRAQVRRWRAVAGAADQWSFAGDVSGTIAVANKPIAVSVSLHDGGQWTIQAGAEGNPLLPSLAELAALAGLADPSGSLQETLEGFGLGAFTLTSFAVDFDRLARKVTNVVVRGAVKKGATTFDLSLHLPSLQLTGGLAQGSSIALSAMLPDSAQLPSGFPDPTFTRMSISLDLSESSLSFGATATIDWKPVPGLVELDAMRVDLSLSKASGRLAVSGLIGMYLTLANTRLELAGAFGDTFTFSTGVPEMNLSTFLGSFLKDVAPPSELPDVQLSNIKLGVTPSTGAYSFAASAQGEWGFDALGGGVKLTGLDVSLSRSGTGAAVECSLTAAAAGPVQIADGTSLDTLSLSFNKSGTGWTVSGTASGSVLDHAMTLQASASTTNGTRAFSFSWTSEPAVTLVALDAVGSLQVSRVALTVSKTATATAWTASGDAALSLQDLMNVSGTLELESSATRTGFALTNLQGVAVSAAVELVPGNPDWKLSLGVQLDRLSLYRKQTTGWTFEAATGLTLGKLPGSWGEALPSRIGTTFRADRSGVALTIDTLVDAAPIPLPSLADGPELGNLTIGIKNVALTLAQRPTFSADLMMGIPPQANNLFGSVKGQPKHHVFNDQLRFTLGVDTLGVFFRMLTPPFNFGSLKQDAAQSWIHLDLGEVGEVRFTLPMLRFDATAFAVQGEFEQVRRLALPLGLIKSLMRSAHLDAIANALPATLPLTELQVFPGGRLDVNGFVTALTSLGKAIHVDLPEDVLRSALQAVAGHLDRLPSAFKNYLNVELPQKLKFAFALTPGTGLGLKLDLRTPNDQPLELLLPSMGMLGPAFTGIQLRRLSIGAVLSGALIMVEVDGQADFFDLVTLAAIVALPPQAYKVLPEPDGMHRQVIARELLMVVPPEFPVPIPIFYDEVGFDALGLEGIGLGMSWSFPRPQGGISALASLFKDMLPFFTDPKAHLGSDFFDRHGLALTFSIDPAYFATPRYLGERTFGSRGEVFEISLSSVLATVLDTLKDPRPGRLLRTVPLDKRLGVDHLRLGPMVLDLAWAATTPEEFRDVVLPGLTQMPSRAQAPQGSVTTSRFAQALRKLPKDTQEQLTALAPVTWKDEDGALTLLLGGWSVKGLIDLDVQLGLAASASEGFGIGLGFSGDVAGFMKLQASGVFVVDTKDSRMPVRLKGTSALQLAGREVFHGTLQLDDSRFLLDGELALFPKSSPLQVGGKGVLEINRDGKLRLRADADVSLANFTLSSRKLEVTNSSITVSGTYLGVGASFDARVKDGTLTLHGLATLSWTVSFDVGPIKDPITGLTLADHLTLGNTGLKAALDITLGEAGFASTVAASAAWNGKTWKAPNFSLSVSPSDAKEVLEKVEAQFKRFAQQIFSELWSDAGRWLSSVKSGVLQLGQDMAYLGKVLDKTFKKSADDASRLLKGAGYSAQQTGKALAGAYGKGAVEVARLLRSANYAADDVARSLQSNFDYGAEQVASTFKAIGYGSEQAASALKNVFNTSAKDTAKYLKSAYDLGDKALKSALEGAGYAANKVKDAVESIFGKIEWNPTKW